MARIKANRLATAARHGFEKLSWWREFYTFACKEIAGPWYEMDMSRASSRAADEKRAVSILANMVMTYLPELVGEEMKAVLKPLSAGMQDAAQLRGLRLTKLLQEIRYAETDRMVVLDALIGGLGVKRIGRRDGGHMITVDGETYDPGQPFCVRVAPGNLTMDPFSRNRAENQFEGDRFICDRALLLEAGIGDARVIEQLPTIGEVTQHADPNSPLRLAGFTREAMISDDMIELWNLTFWDGRKRLECVVSSLEEQDAFIIPPTEYQGPEEGPYEFISLIDRPDRTNGISPAMWLMDLHKAAAATSTRLVDDVLSTVRLTAVNKSERDEGAQSIDEAQHNDIVFINDVNGIKEMVRGGMVAEIEQGYQKIMEMADTMGSNLMQDAGRRNGGEESATKTAVVADRVASLRNFLLEPINASRSRDLKRLAWYEDTAPVVPQEFMATKGMGAQVQVLYDEETKEGEWLDYGYKMQVLTPASMDENAIMARMTQAIQVIPPWLMAVAQLGGNVQAAVRMVAVTFGCPEIEDVFPTQGGMLLGQAMAQAGGQPGQPIGMAPVGGQQPAQPPGAAGKPTDKINQTRSDASASAPIPAGA